MGRLIRKSLVFVCAVGVGFCVLFSNGDDARAATVTCTGTETITTVSYVFYDASANTCTVSDTGTALAVGDMRMSSTPQAGGGARTQMTYIADNNLDGTLTQTDNGGCTIGDTGTLGAGGSCLDSDIASGSYNDSLTALVSAGTSVTMNVSYTVVSGTSLDITSASVTIPDAASSSTTTTSSGTSSQTLVAAVSGTQTRFTTQNIQRHIDVVSGGGVAGATPSAGSGTSTGGDESQSNFTGFSTGRMLYGLDATEASFSNTYGTSDYRDAVAMILPKLSFDTARGDSIASFFGLPGTLDNQGDRLNQVQEEIDSEVTPGVPTGIVRTKKTMHVWAYGSYSDMDNSRNATDDDQRYTGDSYSVTAGIDQWINDKWLAGVALSYANTQLDTTFNDGSYDEDAYSVSPYILFQPLQWLTVNASAGYTYSDIEQEQDKTSSIKSSDTTADTYYGSLNAKGTYTHEALTIAGSLGYTRSHRDIAGYNDSAGTVNGSSKSNSSQIRAGLEAGYAFSYTDNTIQPFVVGDYLYEYQNLTNDDPSAAEVGGGIKWSNTPMAMNASLEGTMLIGRDDYDQWSVRGIVAKGLEGFGSEGSVTPEANFTVSADALSIGMGARSSVWNGSLVLGISTNITHQRRSDNDASFGARLSADLLF